jgi:hypothetical protein
MGQKGRSNIAAGVLLILFGAAFLAAQLAPGIFGWLRTEQSWPLIIIGVGVILLVIGLLVGEPGMLVPAAIVGGVGGLLYWQSITGRWETWAYAWTLIPGFVGVGVFFSRLIEGRIRQAFTEGGQAILISIVLFAVFGTFLGRHDFPNMLLPVLLIGAGLLVMINTLLSRSK